MSHDFDRVIDRRGSGCYRYDALKMIYGREDLISLWVADMDFEVAPAVKEAMRKRLEHGVFGYNLHPPAYYEAVQWWVETRYGYRVERDWIVNSPGVMPAVNIAVLQLTEPGDGILIQPPVYKPFFDAIRGHGRHLLTNPLLRRGGRHVIDFDDLERKLKQARLFILCSPHNPVGRLWSEEELLQMGQLCRKYRVPIISDEIHADLVYEGAGALSIAALEDFAEFTVACVSPAKSFNLAGLASAVIIIKDPALHEKVGGMITKTHLFLGNSFGIAAIIAAYRDSDDWLQELLLYLKGNRDYLCDFLARELPQLKLTQPESTYLAWIDFRALGLDDAALKDFLVNKARLALDPGTKYGVEGSGFQRLNFALPRSLLAEALRRLKQAFQEESL